MAAAEVPIKGGDEKVKLRNPVNSALLDVVTVGIYGIFWYYYANKELAALGRARGRQAELGDNPTNSLLALFPGIIVLVPAISSFYNAGERVEAAQRGAGLQPTVNAAIATVALFIFFPVGIYYLQIELNKVWEREAEGAAGELPGGSGDAAPAEPAEQPTEAPGPE